MNRLIHFVRRPAASGGFITLGTLLVAAVSAILLMTGCRLAPAATPTAEPAKVGAAAPASAFASIEPFDEHFYTAPADDAEPSQNGASLASSGVSPCVTSNCGAPAR